MPCPFLMDLWRDMAGMPPASNTLPPPRILPPLSRLRETEWSPRFEGLMRNRLIMGAFRYATMEEKRGAGAGKWDLLGTLKRKAELYERTGNAEILVDIANYALLAFEFDAHPSKHFSATDDQDHCIERGA